MKFKVLSHAGMLVEDKGKTLLFDPWLVGSCYWRSWWNFPEIDREEIREIKPDYIYLTHLHWDHFHAPSMRLFDRDVTYLVPKIPGTRMVRDLKSCKFNNIVEIAHGDRFELWENCFLHSFQFGLFSADSTAVVSDGETTLFNANDCKTFGLPLKQITKRFPKVDFCFRSHSSATPIPYTIKDYKEKFNDFRTAQNYIEEFTNFSLAVGARYAVPFASNHCFLHKETVKFNETGVNPQMVADYYNANERAKAAGSECVIMVPGSSWDSEKGFDLRPFDYSQKDRIIAEMQEKYREKLEKQYAKEEKIKASFKAFHRYFSDFLESTPVIARKMLLPKIQFHVTDPDGEHFWFVDAPNKKIEELKEKMGDAEITVSVPALVLNDCVRRKMFSVWSASKRLEVELEKDKLAKFHTLLSLLDFYENEGLPLRSNFSARNFPIWLSRWREAAEAARLVLVYKVLRRKLVISELYSGNSKSELTLSAKESS
jgi:UDP-MurNAc hydroxylase